MNKLSRFAMRTTDADAARDFYATILGHRRAEIWPLHEQALARGARPHWLGHLEVDDAERAGAAFIERGAMQLGPTLSTADGGRTVVLRDPGGAVLALATHLEPRAGASAEVVWQVLNTNDAARAARNYAELFGWEMLGRVDLGGRGVFQQFAWHVGGGSVGAIGDVAARPGVHPHWLFFFEVDALDQSLAKVRDADGVVVEASALPSGQRYAVCDDPQGAAFGLWERRAA